MGDVTFSLFAVPNRYQDVVQRMAVLYPLRGIAETGQGVREKTTELITQWRARVGALTNAGWDPSLGGKSHHSILYTRNCRPTFAMTDRPTRVCTKSAVCPFCYARTVREIWMQIDPDFPSPDPLPGAEQTCEDGRELRSILLDQTIEEPTRRHTTEFRFHLLTRHHRYTRPVQPPVEQDIDVRQNLAIILQNVLATRQRLIQLIDPVGAFLYTTVVPTSDGRSWEIHNRQIFKVIPATVLPEDVGGVVTRIDRPYRRAIMRAVADVCRYPVPMMTGDSGLVAAILDARRMVRFRSFEFYRSFRNRRQHE